MKAKGVLLYSGGLDSLLAAKILMEQDIDLIGLHFVLPFYPPGFNFNELDAAKQAKKIGLKLKFYKCGQEYLQMLKNPIHGYGKNINPCIDCRIFFINKAAEYMEQLNADFVATGEVVGQRPMSQLKHTLRHIEKSTNLTGRLLRPLSAKILKPTIAENEGKIDRTRLLDLNGRGRKRQFKLAEEYGITDYSSPSGGCLFTDKNIASRIKDIFDKEDEIKEIDLYLSTIGRQFRTDKNSKIIMARNEQESMDLENIKQFADSMLYPEFRGPTVFIKGKIDDKDLSAITSIMARYGKPEPGKNKISLIHKNSDIVILYAEKGDYEWFNKFKV